MTKEAEQKNELEFIEMYKNLSNQERLDLHQNLKIIGCSEKSIQWFTIHYSKYLTTTKNHAKLTNVNGV